MRTFFLFMGAICFVLPAILLVTDASPPKISTSNSPSSPGNSEPNAEKAESVKLDEKEIFGEGWWDNDKAEELHKLLLEQNTPVLTLQNQWDSTACHPGLKLSGLIAEYTGDNTGFRSVFAEESIPNQESGIFYFEVKILARTGYVQIGFAPKEMGLKKAVGSYKGAYAYKDTGSVTGGPRVNTPFDVNDFVGCGVNLKTRQIFYTINGKRFETTKLSANVTVAQLFPCVSMHDPGSIIEANFGLNGLKDFQFNFENAI